ncbi:UNKNOWN [Stylonychia lemnae]|uniref:Uncharacterized protein n=1 Tax=Stylonychia lemnae TaxID=5949 RepID=A0A078B0D2_STYLE|nr:UNKNOWN [Stylonychia lemnae]|eukprot:CDW86857.1 UNKNOWN [Stylonychia lemnae]
MSSKKFDKDGTRIGVTIEVVNIGGRNANNYDSEGIQEEQGNTKSQNIRRSQIILENLQTPLTLKIEETNPVDYQQQQHHLLKMPEMGGNQDRYLKMHSLSKLSSASLLDSSYGDSFNADIMGSAANLFDQAQELKAVPLLIDNDPITQKKQRISRLQRQNKLFGCLPKMFQLELKRNVTQMTLVTCFVYDFVIFLILAINLNFGQQGLLQQTELSLAFSCLMFGFMFDLLGRKQIFTMRVCVTSIATMLVPYIKFFPITSLALVMSSVSLTVPYHVSKSLFKQYRFIFIQVEVHKDVNINMFFLIGGILGLVTAFTFCWHFFDIYKNRFFVGTSEDITTSEKQRAILYIVTGIALVPALFYTGIKADKKPAWRMLLREYLFLVLFLLIFGIRQGYSKHQDFFKLLGFAGCMFIIFNIYMTQMIILSKTVRRECRGAMYGITSACGAIGGFSGLSLGRISREMIGIESLYALEILFASIIIISIYMSRIYEDKIFERPLQFKKKIMRLTNILQQNEQQKKISLEL